MTDWDDGTYELTADALAPAADAAVQAARLEPSEWVLDVACGTGNVAELAARAGARVTGVDPAARLLDVARRRVPAGEFVRGDGAALPFARDSFDATLSVFGVIFVPDAAAAVAELVRVTRPGGRIVLTTWVAEGAIAAAGSIVREAAAGAAPPRDGARPPAAWGSPAFLHEAFDTDGATVTVSELRLPFVASSPTAWWDEQETHHPVWRAARAALAERGASWDEVRARGLEVLTAQNEDPAAFCVTSRYLLVRVDLAAA